MIASIFGDSGSVAVDPVWKYYAENLRTGMFTGFLTMASFLLTMTTFVVMNLKTQYYDMEEYDERVKVRRAKGSKRSYYFPLKNLGMALIGTILLALLTSVAQFTIGLHQAFWSVLVCGGLAGLTVCMLAFSLFQIFQNMRQLFGAWEKKKEPPAPRSSTQS